MFVFDTKDYTIVNPTMLQLMTIDRIDNAVKNKVARSVVDDI